MSFSPTHPIDECFFEDVFIEELDSWFTADIACCDNCYDKFLKMWPAAYDDNSAEFQTNGTHLDTFYEGSRINAFYSREQFERLFKELDCPRCGDKLNGMIYPYELPFDVPEDFEESVSTISEIARNTPFLLLKNAFAQEVFEVIETLYKTTGNTKINSSLFRARRKKGLSEISLKQFNFADPEYIGEGRYNHAAQQVLYLGDSKETCFHELRGVRCIIAEIAITAGLKILDLSSPHESHVQKSDLLNALTFSALLSTPEEGVGYNKPAYVFSRFIADCARFTGFDAIRYPSTQAAEKSYNLAILNSEFAIVNRSNLLSLCDFNGKKSRLIDL